MKKKNNKSVVLVGIISVFLYIVYCILYRAIYLNTSDSNLGYTLDILGWLLYLFCICTWYNKTNKVIDLYTIFITLFFLFNYGQCLMWGLNIHKTTEIGQSFLFSKYRIYNNDIILAQLLTLICILLFHFGAMIAAGSKIKAKNNNISAKEKKIKKIIFITCKILLLFVVPVTYYIQYRSCNHSPILYIISYGYYK